MGKQIRFYMSDADEDAFVSYVRTTGDVVIVPQTSEGELSEEFSSFRALAGRKFGESCHVWNRSISPTPISKHYSAKGYYWLDFMQSEVVNVMRSKKTDRGLSMGRLHIEDEVRQADGSTTPKSIAFQKWFSMLCRWIERGSLRKVDGAYVLAGAAGILEGGVAATGHSF